MMRTRWRGPRQASGHAHARWALIAAWSVLIIAVLLARSPARAQRAVAGPPTVPHRIISLIPSVTEMLFAIGAGQDVIGVSSFDHFPPAVESRVKVGGLLDPDFERILSLRPDLVVVYGTQSSLIDRLNRAGIAIFPYQHAGLADITQTLRQVGARTGRADPADRLASTIERRIEEIRERMRALPQPRTMIVFEREAGTLRGMFASGGVGFLHDMLVAAGGTDVFADVPRQSLQVTTEIALAKAPEVIVEIHSGPGWTADRISRERDVWRGLPSVPAVRTGRIYLLTDELMSIPGPRVVQAIEAIAKVLHPNGF
jgi:iron complex transport system substrate-binding protein